MQVIRPQYFESRATAIVLLVMLMLRHVAMLVDRIKRLDLLREKIKVLVHHTTMRICIIGLTTLVLRVEGGKHQPANLNKANESM
jgi:hypothetical protein